MHKKEFGPYCGFGYSSLVSDPLILAKGARGKKGKFANFNVAAVSKTDISKKNSKILSNKFRK